MQQPNLSAFLEAMRAELAADRAQAHPARHAHVLRAVAIAFGLRPADILGRHRYAELCDARFAYYWTCRHRLHSDFSNMARHLRGRDHTTAVHGVNRAEELRRQNPLFAARLAEIEAMVWPRGWKAPAKPLSKFCGVAREPWRARQVLAALAQGDETAPAISARIGCNESGARSALVRLRAAGAVELSAPPPPAATPGGYRRYRIAEPAAQA